VRNQSYQTEKFVRTILKRGACHPHEPVCASPQLKQHLVGFRILVLTSVYLIDENQAPVRRRRCSPIPSQSVETNQVKAAGIKAQGQFPADEFGRDGNSPLLVLTLPLTEQMSRTNDQCWVPIALGRVFCYVQANRRLSASK
jgi:hypothetical protein